MAGVDRAALMNYMASSVTTLHAEDQRLGMVLRRVQRARTISTEDFEALIDAQQTALRGPANVMMMVLSFMEGQAMAEPEAPVPLRTRARAALKVLMGR